MFVLYTQLCGDVTVNFQAKLKKPIRISQKFDYCFQSRGSLVFYSLTPIDKASFFHQSHMFILTLFSILGLSGQGEDSVYSRGQGCVKFTTGWQEKRNITTSRKFFREWELRNNEDALDPFF